MIEIEKYARAAASTARTPPNSPARRAAIEVENAARVAAEQFVKALTSERDELREQAAQIERLQHQADQADQIDVRGIVGALSWMGVSTPDGGTEAAAARLGRLANDLSAAVLRHKMGHQSKTVASTVYGTACIAQNALGDSDE